MLCLQGGCLSAALTPTIAAVLEAFRRCVVEVAPLVHSQTLPPRHIDNFVEYQVRQQRVDTPGVGAINARPRRYRGSSLSPPPFTPYMLAAPEAPQETATAIYGGGALNPVVTHSASL